MSTVLLSQEKLMASLQDCQSRPFFQSHGQQDQVLRLSQGRQLHDLLKSLGWRGEWHEFAGGHEIPLPVLEKAKAFLQSL